MSKPKEYDPYVPLDIAESKRLTSMFCEGEISTQWIRMCWPSWEWDDDSQAENSRFKRS